MILLNTSKMGGENSIINALPVCSGNLTIKKKHLIFGVSLKVVLLVYDILFLSF